MKIINIPLDDIAVAIRVVEVCSQDAIAVATNNLREYGVTDKRFLEAYTWAEHVEGALAYLKKMRDIQTEDPMGADPEGDEAE